MDGVTLGKGNFARVELATHGVTQLKVILLYNHHIGPQLVSPYIWSSHCCQICWQIPLFARLTPDQTAQSIIAQTNNWSSLDPEYISIVQICYVEISANTGATWRTNTIRPKHSYIPKYYLNLFTAVAAQPQRFTGSIPTLCRMLNSVGLCFCSFYHFNLFSFPWLFHFL